MDLCPFFFMLAKLCSTCDRFSNAITLYTLDAYAHVPTEFLFAVIQQEVEEERYVYVWVVGVSMHVGVCIHQHIHTYAQYK